MYAEKFTATNNMNYVYENLLCELKIYSPSCALDQFNVY